MLERNYSYKPLDFGNGLVAGSVNDRGRLVSLNTYQPQYGYVTLTNMQPFLDGRWYNSQFVRDYRAEQASRSLPGFGLYFDAGKLLLPETVCYIETGALPLVQLNLAPNIQAEILTFAPFFMDNRPARSAIQLCTIYNPQLESLPLNYGWSGEIALTRASYAQLTEGGPIARPPDNYVTAEAEGIFTLENSGLGWAVAIAIAELAEDCTIQKILSGWQVEDRLEQEKLGLSLSQTLTLEPERDVHLAVIYSWGATGNEAREQLSALLRANLDELQANTTQLWQTIDEINEAATWDKALPGLKWLVRQNLVYILACCAVPLEKKGICLITDHQLLPLAWTRDAYYAVQALLTLRKQAQNSESPAKSVRDMLDNIVRQHLIWLFEVAERPQNYWGRAYLTNGKCKDIIYQLDQQCYPLLELADYIEITGDTALAQRLKPQVEEVLTDLLAHRAKEAWLFPTSETPADDKVELPYHLSSQIAVWYTFKRLAELDILEHYPAAQLGEIAQHIHQDIYQHMVGEYQGQKIFCYLTDLAGNYRFYHDANDWPTVLAFTWGFCALDDPIWRATLDFAFSPANKDGFYPGEFGGLGSVHTSHPWPLGDIQEIFLAGLLKDETRRAKCWTKLSKIACWDGNFPEAYDENNGQVASRHWFAWPGAMLSFLIS